MQQELQVLFAAVFEEVDDALEQKLSKIMFEGPEPELTLTENAQPALMAMSVALIRVLEKQAEFHVATESSFVAGHSLGEYSALTAAGTFSLGDAARVLKMRGQSMQQAVPVGQGAMAAIIGVDLDVAEEIDRLHSHVAALEKALKKKEPIGRRLDFLMQELNREANTLSSKSIDAGVTRTAVDLKVLIEQMREQVQNIA